MLGAPGVAWIERLPAIVNACAQRWSLTLDPPFPQLSINYAAPGLGADGVPIVLKVCIPGPEFATEAESLRLFDGHGAVKLLAVDRDQGALLLERLRPGTPLLDIDKVAAPTDDDEKATRIAASVMRQLWQPAPASHPFPSFADWMRHMAEQSPRLVRPDKPLLRHWIARALDVYSELTAKPAEPVLLHGDLHHGNILRAEREPWLAIDPKGVVGESVCETGPLLLNALPDASDLAETRRVLARRADVLADVLGFDRAAVRAWGVVRAVLASFWTLEDHGRENLADLMCAEALAARR